MEGWLIWAAICAGGAFGVLLALLIAAERELRGYREMEAESEPFPIVTGTPAGEPQSASRIESRLADFEKERSQLLAQIAELKEQNEAKQERILKLKSAEGQRLEGVQQRLPEMERQVMELLNGLRMVLKGGDSDVSRGFEANK